MEVVSEEEENRRYAAWTREAQIMPLSTPEIEASVERCAALWIQKILERLAARKAYRLEKRCSHQQYISRRYGGDILHDQD